MTIYLLLAPVTFCVAPSLAYSVFFSILGEDVIGHNIAPERILELYFWNGQQLRADSVASELVTKVELAGRSYSAGTGKPG